MKRTLLSDATGPVIEVRGANQGEREFDFELLLAARSSPPDSLCRLVHLLSRRPGQSGEGSSAGGTSFTSKNIITSSDAITCTAHDTPVGIVSRRRVNHQTLLSRAGQHHRPRHLGRRGEGRGGPRENVRQEQGNVFYRYGYFQTQFFNQQISLDPGACSPESTSIDNRVEKI